MTVHMTAIVHSLLAASVPAMPRASMAELVRDDEPDLTRLSRAEQVVEKIVHMARC